MDGKAALSWVADTDVYDMHVDDRPKGTLNGQQNTGFAFMRRITVARQPDFEALDIRGDGRLRYDAWIDLMHSGLDDPAHVGTPLVVGNAYGFGVILHIHAESPTDLSNALRVFAQVPGVTGVLTLALRTPQ